MNAVPKLLFVDDDPQMLASLARNVREWKEQWDMRFLASAAEALDMLHGSGQAVVVTDWMMPGMSGLQFCRRLRAAEARGDCLYSYVIMLTGRQDIDHTVHALDQGADDFLSKPFHARELLARIRVGLRMLDLQRGLRDANERLASLASTDALTGLANRRSGTVTLREQLKLVRRSKQDLSIVMIDLDRFKPVNDTHGHEAGDKLLCTVAQRLRDACRGYDTVIRWGGDEMLALCPHATEYEVADIAERMRLRLSSVPLKLDDGTCLHISASFGTATAAKGTDMEAEDLLRVADERLYEAKAAGRNTIMGGRI